MPRANRKILTQLLDLPGNKVVEYTCPHEKQIILTIEAEEKEATCPRCHHTSYRLHQNHVHLIKDLPWGEKKVILQTNRRQFKCTRCQKPFSENLDYVEIRRKYTKRLAEKIVREVTQGDIHSVAARYGVKDSDVQKMVEDVGKLKIEPPSTELRKLGIDEISLVKGQGNYVAVLVDIEKGKLLDIVKSRKKEDVREVLQSWGDKVLNGIEEVSMDMWKPYGELVEELMPNAEAIADRFHVAQTVNNEVDACRRTIKREAQKIKKKSEKESILEVLKHGKYPLLKNENDLNEKQMMKLEELRATFPELEKVHRLKEELRQIYDLPGQPGIKTLEMLDWLREAAECLPQSVGTICRWFEEIMGYFEERTTQGTVEGINNRLKLIKRLAYGFRNLGNFRLRSLLCWCF